MITYFSLQIFQNDISHPQRFFTDPCLCDPVILISVLFKYTFMQFLGDIDFDDLLTFLRLLLTARGVVVGVIIFLFISIVQFLLQ